MLVAAWMVLSLTGSGLPKTQTETVDLIEINTCYQEVDGKQMVAYRQMIAWEWSPDYSRMHVVGWMLLDEKKTGQRKERVTRRDTSWVFNCSNGLVISKHHIETHTHKDRDPERLNQAVFPERFRTGLFKSKSKELLRNQQRQGSGGEGRARMDGR